MKKYSNSNRIYFLIFFIIIIIAVAILAGIFMYRSFFKEVDFVILPCLKKNIIWSKKSYNLGQKEETDVMLKAEKTRWIRNLKPLKIEERSRAKIKWNSRFTICQAFSRKFPDFLFNDPTLDEESKKAMRYESAGLIVDIGQKKWMGLWYKSIIRLKFNIYLDANRYSSENYNLDAFLQYLAQNYTLVDNKDGSLYLKYIGKGEEAVVYNGRSFFFSLAEILDKEATEKKDLRKLPDFVSHDKGASWKVFEKERTCKESIGLFGVMQYSCLVQKRQVKPFVVKPHLQCSYITVHNFEELEGGRLKSQTLQSNHIPFILDIDTKAKTAFTYSASEFFQSRKYTVVENTKDSLTFSFRQKESGQEGVEVWILSKNTGMGSINRSLSFLNKEKTSESLSSVFYYCQ